METETTELESTESTEETSSDDTEETSSETQETTSEDRPNRKERRANKLAEANRAASEAAELRKELAAEREARQRHAEEAAELRGQMSARQQQEKPDPWKDRIADLNKRAKASLNAASSAKDAATAQHYLGEYEAAKEEVGELRGRKAAIEEYEERAKSAPDPAVHAQRMTLESEFPWLSDNVKARRAADGWYEILVAQGKTPKALSTLRAACANAARDFGLGGTGGQSNGKGRFSVPSGREGAAGDGGSSSFTAKDMTRQQERMAEDLYGHLPKEQAHAEWAKKVYPKTVKQTA